MKAKLALSLVAATAIGAQAGYLVLDGLAPNDQNVSYERLQACALDLNVTGIEMVPTRVPNDTFGSPMFHVNFQDATIPVADQNYIENTQVCNDKNQTVATYENIVNGRHTIIYSSNGLDVPFTNGIHYMIKEGTSDCNESALAKLPIELPEGLPVGQTEWLKIFVHSQDGSATFLDKFSAKLLNIVDEYQLKVNTPFDAKIDPAYGNRKFYEDFFMMSSQNWSASPTMDSVVFEVHQNMNIMPGASIDDVRDGALHYTVNFNQNAADYILSAFGYNAPGYAERGNPSSGLTTDPGDQLVTDNVVGVTTAAFGPTEADREYVWGDLDDSLVNKPAPYQLVLSTATIVEGPGFYQKPYMENDGIRETKFDMSLWAHVSNGSCDKNVTLDTAKAGEWTRWGYFAQIPEVQYNAEHKIKTILKFTNRDDAANRKQGDLNVTGEAGAVSMTLIDKTGRVVHLTQPAIAPNTTVKYTAHQLLTQAQQADPQFDADNGSFSLEVGIAADADKVYGSATFKNLENGVYKALPLYHRSHMSY